MFFESGTLLAGQNLVNRINRMKKTIETISVLYIFPVYIAYTNACRLHFTELGECEI